MALSKSPRRSVRYAADQAVALRGLVALDQGALLGVLEQLRPAERLRLIGVALAAGSNRERAVAVLSCLANASSSADAPATALQPGQRREYPGLYLATSVGVRGYFGAKLSDADRAVAQRIAEIGRGRREKANGDKRGLAAKKRLLMSILPGLIGASDAKVMSTLKAAIGPNLAIDPERLRDAMRPGLGYTRDKKDTRWQLERSAKRMTPKNLYRMAAEVCSAIGLSKSTRTKSELNIDAQSLRRLIRK